MRCGALLSGFSSRDLQADRLFSAMPRMPSIPANCDWSEKMSKPIGMLGNDKYGSCTVTSIAHMVNCWRGQHGLPQDIDTDEVVRAYKEMTGGQDSGLPLRPVLDRFHGKKNQSIGGHRCSGFLRLNHRDINSLRAAIYLFGGAYVAFVGPPNITDMDSWKVEAPKWDADQSKGHCVCLLGYDNKGFTAASWNALPRMSLGYWTKYSVEAWAPVSSEWFYPGGVSPSKVALSEVTEALRSIAA